jgi:3D (Asp-Asp-Asp) domain-containing protein
MALHLSGKLCAIGIVIASLLTAFNTPPVERTVDLTIVPAVVILSEPYIAHEVGRRYAMQGPDPNPSFVLRATGYNSLPSQTNAQPFITATGARTHWGIIAVSRDLLSQDIPYGSLVRIKDLGGYNNGRGYGQYQSMLDEQGLFIVEDTMNRRKTQQIDVWFPEYNQAINWGMRRVELKVVRYGRHGPVLDRASHAQDLAAVPQLQPARMH